MPRPFKVSSLVFSLDGISEPSRLDFFQSQRTLDHIPTESMTIGRVEGL